MKKNVIYLWIVICTVSLLILMLFGTYSFAKPLSNNEEVINENNLKITYLEGNEINTTLNTNLKETKNIVVENKSKEEVEFKIRWKNLDNNVYNKESLINTIKVNNEVILNEEVVESALNYPILENLTIEPNQKLKIEFNLNYEKGDFDQEKDINNKINGELEIVYQSKKDGYLKSNPEYEITYNLNGGYLDYENPNSYTSQTPTITLNNPKKMGYKFNGWSEKNSEKTSLKIIPKGSTGNKSFIANYEAITYNVKFNANGGTGKMNDMLMYYDKEYKLTKNKYKKEGYTFQGWSLEKDGEIAFADRDIVYNLSINENEIINLYAVWEK